MQNLMTLLGGASLGAGAMYLMDPDRGRRRRAGLRETLAEVADSELVERARQIEPMTAVRQLGDAARQFSGTARQLGGGAGVLLEAARLLPVSRSRGWRRRSSMALSARDWVLLGGLIGATTAGLWLARRAMNTGEGIRAVRTLTVEVPVAQVYEFWTDFENFPRFMSHVREVRRVGPDRTHWIVAGPGGTPIEWEAVVTERVPNEVIGWRTVKGSLVEHRGTVLFRPLGNGTTRIEVQLTYRPLGGMLAHKLAEVFGSDPARVIEEDLDRFAAQLRGVRPAVGEAGQWR